MGSWGQKLINGLPHAANEDSLPKLSSLSLSQIIWVGQAVCSFITNIYGNTEQKKQY